MRRLDVVVLALLVTACSDRLTQPPETPTVTITAPRTSLEVGDTVQLQANVAVTWTTSNAAVLAVDANGLAHAVSVGEADITATAASHAKATLKLTVLARPPVRVETNQIPLLFASDTFRVVARAFDRADSLVVDTHLAFASDNTAVFSVDSAGLIRAIADGSARLSISVNGRTLATLPVTVALVRPGASQSVIAGGFNTEMCALTPSHEVYCWGENNHLTPTRVDTPPLKSIVQGNDYACGLQLDGAAYCWGDDYTGHLGSPTALKFSSLTAYDTTCGVELSGEVYCWGNGYFGQLGDGKAGQPGADGAHFSATPVRVALPEAAVAVAAGEQHVCALAASGHVYCWGNKSAALGRGESTEPGAYPVPMPPRPIQTTAQIARIASGARQSCALTVSGQELCWGDGPGHAVQGSAPLIDISLSQTHLCSLSKYGDAICTGVWWRNGWWSEVESFGTLSTSGLRFAAVAAGTSQTCGVSVSGSAYCWGSRANGGLGDGSTFDYRDATPVASSLSFAAMASADGSTCALTSAGNAYCWGPNTTGQLGDGTVVDRVAPTPQPGSLTFRAIAGAGASINGGRFCALDMNGKPYCWGYVDYNLNLLTPTPVATDQSFTQIAVSPATACALTEAGDAYCWGAAGTALGSGDRTASATPRLVVGGLRYRAIASEGGAYCAVTMENDIACWGQAGPALFGTATTTERCTVSLYYSEACSSVPVRIPGTSGAIGVGGRGVPCMVSVDGEVKCWGTFYNGTWNCSMYGKYPGTCVYTPTLADGATNIRAMFGLFALRDDGRLYKVSAPMGYYGLPSPFQLTEVRSSVPFSSSGGEQCALSTARLAYCWGANDHGQVGNGQVPIVTTPTLVSSSVTFGQ